MNYFTLHEFFRHLSNNELNSVFNQPVLFERLVHFYTYLNLIRSGVDNPIYINSWYRDFEHNKLVGGSSTSQHLSGSAVDISCDDCLSVLRYIFIRSVLPDNTFGQIIFYPARNFIHLALPCSKYPVMTLFVSFGDGMKRFDVVSDYLNV